MRAALALPQTRLPPAGARAGKHREPPLKHPSTNALLHP